MRQPTGRQEPKPIIIIAVGGGHAAWGAPSAAAGPGWVAALSPGHTAQAWAPRPGLHALSPSMYPEGCPAPAPARSPLTAEPLWPASPRSPGMPTSPYAAGREGVRGALPRGGEGWGRWLGAGTLTGMPGSPKGPASPSSPALPCGGWSPEHLRPPCGALGGPPLEKEATYQLSFLTLGPCSSGEALQGRGLGSELPGPGENTPQARDPFWGARQAPTAEGLPREPLPCPLGPHTHRQPIGTLLSWGAMATGLSLQEIRG